MSSQGGKPRSSSAAGPAAGYYYQLRYGLLRALQMHKKYPTGRIVIETIDDVTFIADSLQIDSQLKHSVEDQSSLSKYDPGVWRTFAIWLDRMEGGLAEEHEFHLVTTSKLAENDPLMKLTPGSDDLSISTALTELEVAAKQSTNAASAKDRARFLACSPGDRLSLLRRVRIVRDTPDIGAIAGDIDSEIHFACEPAQVGEFRSDLEGWWVSRVLDNWKATKGAVVELEEVGGRVGYLRERYERSTLPLDAPDEDCGDLMEERAFIKQIRLVTDSDRRLRNAQKSFLRCATQRSKWVREHRIDPAELDEFDATLCERWEAEHASAVDGLETDCDDEARKNVGRNVLRWAETVEVPIRSTRSTFMTSGSYHALSDDLRVGWHPLFQDFLGGSK
jgi:hypothetical protein